ncbi:cytochrome P450 [Schizophyllum amplum]|uniref:Cytochrome P450 n=1 Tax=Schizophyllum amplum TaxID=97359 RepID=A0A550BY36_9AGAR|nr:cytochrome P450 [Auriculariopsis ampla]
MPSDKQWLMWDEWRRQYGDVVRITVLGQPAIILSSMKAVNDLLESRGHIYSDRPPAVMAGDLVGWARGLGYTNGRQTPVSGNLESSSISLWAHAHSPDDFYDHCRTSTSSTILLMSYGYNATNGDPLKLVKIAEDAMDGFSKASEPGWLVDSLPILKHIPAWFPGASFQRAARAMREDLDRLYDVPLAFVRQELANGTAKPSFLSSGLDVEGAQEHVPSEDLLKAAAGSLYSGGAETTPSALTSFILAMALHPEIQTRAQTEIDNICLGDSSRMPQLADRSKLPYVSAIVKEIWRWNPSVPLGLPHMANADDVYRGYSVDKGTVIWPNIWSILHDESVFPDPLAFRPERYLHENPALKATGGDPNEVVGVAFGVGRRCDMPGMYLGDQAVFIGIASILFAFDISKAMDEAGNSITPVVDYSGFISHPKPFKCSIWPRDGPAREIVQRALESDLADEA